MTLGRLHLLFPAAQEASAQEVIFASDPQDSCLNMIWGFWLPKPRKMKTHDYHVAILGY